MRSIRSKENKVFSKQVLRSGKNVITLEGCSGIAIDQSRGKVVSLYVFCRQTLYYKASAALVSHLYFVAKQHTNRL